MQQRRCFKPKPTVPLRVRRPQPGLAAPDLPAPDLPAPERGGARVADARAAVAAAEAFLAATDAA